MGAMRSHLWVALLACACAPDPFIGSYDAGVTGTDTQTAPTAATSTVSGTGFLAITGSKVDPQTYFLTFGQDGYYCALKATKGSEPLQLKIADTQSCKVGAFTFITT